MNTRAETGPMRPVAPRESLVLAAVSAGGALGAATRWSIGQAWPVHSGAFPWSTLGINIAGCFAIGVLMVLVARDTHHLPYLRPFLAVGVLGGFTTFSTFAVEIVELVTTGHLITAGAYMLTTPMFAVATALLGTRVTAAALLAGAP